ncbi:MAG: amino acid adenylation domain-containing protein [Candidatus Aminicenantes bacterium]|nr:MAG: amino acid adenylation domain-containing protein [Candidatus Aminicenantes bacterium]
MRTHKPFSDKLAIAAAQNIDAEKYWLNKLAGELEKSHFPYDFPKKPKYNCKSDVVKSALPGELFFKLAKLTGGSDVRLFITVSAALVILISKYTHNNDIKLGTSIYRQEPDIEFINTVLVLRNRLKGNITFKDLLIQVGQVILEANKYRNYPIEVLLHHLNIPIPADESFPLFDIAILLENIHNKKYLHPINLNMIFIFKRLDKGMEVNLEYNSLLYKKATAARIISHFTNLLKGAVFNVNLQVSRMDILSEVERKEILFDFNDTQAGYSRDKTMHRLFEEQAENIPGNIAAIGPIAGIDQRLTAYISYRELNRKSNQLARELRTRGIKPNAFAAVIMDRSIEMIIAVMAVLKAGGAYVPLEPHLPEARIITCLASLNVEYLLTNRWQLDKIGKISGELLDLKHIFCLDLDNTRALKRELLRLFKAKELISREEIEKNPGEVPKPRAAAGDFAYVIFTSGTTGTPKGVAEAHRPLINVIQWVNETFQISSTEKLLFVVSLSFDLSVYDIFGILAAGASIRVVGRSDLKLPERLLEIIMEEGITFWDSAPAALQILVPYLQDFNQDMRSTNKAKLRLVFLSGDWIPLIMPDILKEVFEGVRVIGLGGATEASIWSNYYLVDKVDPDWKSIPYGKPIQNAKYYILDQGLNPCPIGVPGDLYIGGECLASGYINDIELTAQKFLDNPFATGEKIYRTGDLARWFPDGNMEFLGRMDNQVKIRGYRIELGEIESQLLAHDEIKETVVLAKEAKSDKYLCAYYVANNEFTGDELSGYLSKTLPHYMIPLYFVKVDKMPLSPNGKIDRKAFPEPGPGIGPVAYAAPRDETEEKLASIWAEILGIEKDIIGIDSNFFELGGHSIKATRLISRIYKELNEKVPLAEVFKTSTIRGLSEYMRGKDKNRVSIEPVEKKDFYELSYNQKQLWIIHQLEYQQLSYNIRQRFELHHPVDQKLIKKTLQKIMQRHESLRTGFKEFKGKPVQFIKEIVDVPLRFIDISYLNDGEKQQEWERIITKVAKAPFDLTMVPLFRSVLIKLSTSHYDLVFVIHHIIADAWSMEILQQEFSIIFEGYRTDKAVQLEPMELQYKDFAQWQNRQINHPEFREKSHHFWLEKLQEGIPALELPMVSRQNRNDYQGVGYECLVEAKVKRQLTGLAQENSTTLSMVTFAIFNILLSLLSNQEDIVCALISAGRGHTALNNTVGHFINSILVKTHVDVEEGFNDFLRRVSTDVIERLEHQNYPLELVLDQLKRSYPEISAAFNMINLEQNEKEWPKEFLESYHREKVQDVKFDIELYIYEYQDCLEISWRFRKSMFFKGVIEYITATYSDLLEELSEESGKQL